MDIQTLTALVQDLENYMAEIRRTIDDIKRQATDTENESSKRKQRAVARIASIAANDPQKQVAAQMIENELAQEQRAAEDHARELRTSADTAQRHLAEVQTVHTELRGLESSMRDLDTRINSWVARAQELRNRPVT
jgi:chromosome segregation ATPase